MKYILKTFVKSTFQETLIRLKRELSIEDFIILEELSLSDILNKKMEVGINYKILVIYHPFILYDGILTDKEAGVLIPFSLVIRELKNSSILICVMNYSIAMKLFSEYGFLKPASATTSKLKKILAKM
ncbi:MAG: hypothetical protein IT281_06265 [Ignavibacteria bacterium]|nr:hypothetical protein [Ignavibacteria bacterium]